KTQESYMSSTCEGTLAWTPSGAYWAFAKNGNYLLRRRDLLACDPTVCKVCDTSRRIVRLAINHSTLSRGRMQCPTGEGIPSNLATFIGVQVVPQFDEATRDTQPVNIWLYRNRRLLRRQSNGAFSRYTSGAVPMSVPIPPLTYNEITLQKSRD